jgi:hypothetical protein
VGAAGASSEEGPRRSQSVKQKDHKEQRWPSLGTLSQASRPVGQRSCRRGSAVKIFWALPRRPGPPSLDGNHVCVYYSAAVPITKLFAWGEGDSGGHVLRETTSRGLCGLVCPSRTSERGGKGDCMKERGGEEGEGERERALGVRLRHNPGY